MFAMMLAVAFVMMNFTTLLEIMRRLGVMDLGLIMILGLWLQTLALSLIPTLALTIVPGLSLIVIIPPPGSSRCKSNQSS